MTRKDLKIIMSRKNTTVQKVANELEVAVASVYDILKGARTSARISKAFETRLDIPFEAIKEAWNNTDDSAESAPEIIAMQKRIVKQCNLKHAVNH